MDDFIKSIKAFLYDRSASPLFGAFIVSFLAWNHRVVMVVLSGDSIRGKFGLMDELLQSTLWGQDVDWSWTHDAAWVPILIKVINVFAMPAFLTWLYLYVYPKIAIPAYQHSLGKQKAIRDLKQSADAIRLLTREESTEINFEMSKMRQLIDETVEEHRKERSNLLQQISELEKEKDNFDTEALSVDDLDEVSRKEIEHIKKEEIQTQAQSEAAMDEHFESSEPAQLPDADTPTDKSEPLDTHIDIDGGTFDEDKKSGLVSKMTGTTSPPETEPKVTDRQILTAFLPDKKFTAVELSPMLRISPDLVKRALDDLVSKGLIDSAIYQSDVAAGSRNSPRYILTIRGRAYVMNYPGSNTPNSDEDKPEE